MKSRHSFFRITPRRVVLIPAALILAAGLTACAEPEPPAPVTSTVTTTAISTVTTTRTSYEYIGSDPTTTRRSSSAAEPSPTQQKQQEQWPGVPYAAGAGMEWATRGPFGSQNPCEQSADAQPQGASTCFQMSDGWYHYFIRQAR